MVLGVQELRDLGVDLTYVSVFTLPSVISPLGSPVAATVVSLPNNAHDARDFAQRYFDSRRGRVGVLDRATEDDPDHAYMRVFEWAVAS